MTGLIAYNKTDPESRRNRALELAKQLALVRAHITTADEVVRVAKIFEDYLAGKKDD